MIHLERASLPKTRADASYDSHKVPVEKPCSVRLTSTRLSQKDARKSRKGLTPREGKVGFVCVFSDTILSELADWPEEDLLTAPF